MMWPKLRAAYDSTYGPAVATVVLFWAALPPWDLWPLAWIAPVGWILLIRRTAKLSGRHPYGTLWLVGWLFWLSAIHWLRLPHWTTAIGWVALSAYLAVYWPLLIALGRTAVHRLRVPVIVAAPVLFAGLELARAHVLTGFSMASLAHTQYHWLTLIQVSDLGGEYLVDFIVMAVAACLGRMIPLEDRPPAFWPLLPALAVVAAALGYGTYRTHGQYTAPGARVALIQGSLDTDLAGELKMNRTQRAELVQRSFEHYLALSQQAVSRYQRLDLLIWPETMFRWPLVVYEPGARPPSDCPLTESEFSRWLQGASDDARRGFERMGRLGVPIIVGLETWRYVSDNVQLFNSALFVDRGGRFHERYDKMHPVMFGEYIPLSSCFPWITRIIPVTCNLDSGARPVAFHVRGLCLSPSICYESVLSHVIRRQVEELAAAGTPPDVLVNLTNDGWFYGSSELDMHLVCGVFRAIECRKPLLIAANTGFSAWIDGNGRVLAQGPRRAPDTLLAEVQVDLRHSPYLVYGDLPAGICLAVCIAVAIVGLAWRRKA
jgi:apolipoprotein N-acyltransferase